MSDAAFGTFMWFMLLDFTKRNHRLHYEMVFKEHPKLNSKFVTKFNRLHKRCPFRMEWDKTNGEHTVYIDNQR